MTASVSATCTITMENLRINARPDNVKQLLIMKDTGSDHNNAQIHKLKKNNEMSSGVLTPMYESPKPVEITASSINSSHDTDHGYTLASPVSVGGSNELIRQRRSRSTPSRSDPTLRRSSFVSHNTDNNRNAIVLSNCSNEDDDDVPTLMVDSNTPTSYVSTIIKDLQWALNDLGWECMDETGPSSSSSSPEQQKESTTRSHNHQRLLDERKLQIEEWARFVHCSLTEAGRDYHDIPHVIDITESASSMQYLAALFRDVISYIGCCNGLCDSAKQLDKKQHDVSNRVVDDLLLTPKQEEILQDVILKKCHRNVKCGSAGRNCTYTCTEIELSRSLNSRTDLVVCQIFGHNPGDDLKRYAGLYRGLDVFFSALVAARLFEKVLSLSQIAQLSTLLQSTISIQEWPERNNSNTPTSLELLYQRLADCNKRFKLAMTNDEMIETVQLGCDLKNRYVGYMAADDIGKFLDYTWKRMPERYPQMRDLTFSTLTDYCMAIKLTEDWVSKLQGESYFLSFRDVPTKEERSAWLQQCSKNIVIMTLYMRVRLVSVAVVGAIACLTGGTNAPHTFFLGDIPSRSNKDPSRLGNGIPLSDDLALGAAVNRTVYDLLRGNFGTISRNEFDTQQAPLAAYIYKELGDDNVQRMMKHCTIPFNKQSAKEILRLLPLHVVQTVAKEVGTITQSRKVPTDRILQGLENDHFELLLMYFL